MNVMRSDVYATVER